ncbi:hypothetical protein O181_003640 [Austropuccinia psidii MF-1]|uniref:Pheromone-processing carboxypeptidase KEX1 n=1 Tax=Austropuccinia psidii MF-1 TaxID=1389203 RepID=A0A9Q3BET8_9BASI|nr:hypothetical protein [Austropuccinia psidii MF-1]
MSSSTDSDLPSSASFYIDSLPGQPKSTLRTLIQYAGHLPSHPPSNSSPAPDSHLWFWLVRSKHISNREKFLIWFNGGPGCSSLEGGLAEIGPFRVKSTSSGKLELQEANFGWSEYASVLFVDQPAGTGYSYVNVSDDVRELAQAAEQMVVFLDHFYKVFPEFSQIDTYLAGESFAGQYIPYFAQAILDTTVLPTILKGILMGNPWIDPSIQYPAYLDFAYEKGLLVKGTAAARKADQDYAACDRILKSKAVNANHITVATCETALQDILSGASKIVDGVKMTPVIYNITQLTANSDRDWPEDIKLLKDYLNQGDTIKAFHAEKKANWALCNQTVGNEMWAPKSPPSSTLLPRLVKKMKVMIYAGDQDYMCNALGVNRSISAMEWNDQKGWGVDQEGNPVEDQEYFVNGTRQGTWIQARGMTFIKFDRASHLVPVDVPLATHDMLLRFLEIDPLLAAGPTRSIPSQVGANNSSGLIMKTFPNGTLLSQDNPKLEADKTSLIGGPPVLETTEERQAYYGPRQTVTLVVVLTGMIVGLVILFKWRRRRKLKHHDRQTNETPIRLRNESSSIRRTVIDRVPGKNKHEKQASIKLNKILANNEESQALLKAEEGVTSEAAASNVSLVASLSELKNSAQIFSLADEGDEQSDD